MEGADQEDGSSMNNKILECRSILQQAGMLEGNGAGQPTEGQGENETEGSKGEGMEDPMSSGNSRRNSRRH
ncbi:hypothetical protein BDFB_011398 [Asbolus verrucosus]|uniref:Uncharacterized protein n=1 Tax=Asbolus verrucosus TaxID=1661398 RepID=A0A482V9W0_ASBVE|nr:hypothetical protein BDFB_011398 [Asbolus verrucosus]